MKSKQYELINQINNRNTGITVFSIMKRVILYFTISFPLFFCFSAEYRTDDPPRIVLDKLEKIGYHVISMTGIGQTCIWLLHKK